MEELRSTDALDKEIREDARKKAEKILIKADEAVKELLDGVDEKIRLAQEDAKNASEKRLATFEKNTNASLPLEKQRLRISAINKTVMDSLNSYLEDLGEEKRTLIIKKEVEKVLPVLETKSVDALVVEGNVASYKKLLEGIFAQKLNSCEKLEKASDLERLEKYPSLNFHDGIILKSTDGSVTCRLTLDEKIKDLFDRHSKELTETLYGGRYPG